MWCCFTFSVGRKSKPIPKYSCMQSNLLVQRKICCEQSYWLVRNSCCRQCHTMTKSVFTNDSNITQNIHVVALIEYWAYCIRYRFRFIIIKASGVHISVMFRMLFRYLLYRTIDNNIFSEQRRKYVSVLEKNKQNSAGSRKILWRATGLCLNLTKTPHVQDTKPKHSSIQCIMCMPILHIPTYCIHKILDTMYTTICCVIDERSNDLITKLRFFFSFVHRVHGTS